MGFATFASVTSFAKQTRAVANVGTPWSLAESPIQYFSYENYKIFFIPINL
ncbi:hypothetical protein LEP1GSC192_0458 [Leptospira sp. B5-022]|nr:hypothetical protein LEP1GSC192_0458 [Leptospira sp. B5-022]